MTITGRVDVTFNVSFDKANGSSLRSSVIYKPFRKIYTVKNRFGTLYAAFIIRNTIFIPVS